MDELRSTRRGPVERGTRAELARQRKLVEGVRATLQAASGGAVALIETHISWVLVGSGEALKIKKAVDLGFVDFTTLERRQRFCHKELRLNRRLAPTLYLDVTPITGPADAPRLGGEGTPIEFAVRMRAFEQEGLWDRLARAGALRPAQLDELAEQLARFHAQADAAPRGGRFGAPDQVRAPVLENFATLDAHELRPDERAWLQALQRWEQASFDAIAPLIERRRTAGRVRECHGDLHLGNIAQVDGRGTVFDAIEFNDDFRFIDVVSEIAFLTMDLRYHRLPALARRFVNRYLECSGDYEGARLLRYYTVYRALVRAKIALLRGRQSGIPRDAWRGDLHQHLALACVQARLQPPEATADGASWPDDDLPPALLITHGCSGSGKTRGTLQLVQADGVLRIRADIERKRLFGLHENARSGSGIDAGLYAPEATRDTYARLLECAVPVIEGGRAALLDATWLKRGARDQARALAARLGVPSRGRGGRRVRGRRGRARGTAPQRRAAAGRRVPRGAGVPGGGRRRRPVVRAGLAGRARPVKAAAARQRR